jgi:MFS family permease
MSVPVIGSEEKPLSDKQVRNGLALNIVAGCLGTAWLAVALNMPYTMLLDALGANGVLQGLSSTIVLLTLAAQIPGALFVERLRHRRIAWAVLAIIHRLLWFIPAYVAWRHPAAPIGANIVVIVMAISMLFGNFSAAAWQSWMADLVPEQSRGRFWSTRQVWTMTAFLLTIGISGFVLDYWKPDDPSGPLTGFAWLFAVAAVLGITDIGVHMGVPEPMPKRTLHNRSLLDRLIAPLQHPNFRSLVLAMGLWMFACTLLFSFTQLYMKHVFHATYRELSAWSIAASISTVVAGLGAGYLIDRVGARAVGAVMIVLAPAFSIYYFFLNNAPLVFHLPLVGTITTSWAIGLAVIVSSISAGFYSVIGLAQMSLMAAVAPERGRTLAMAVYGTLIGVLGAGGPFLGGYIMDSFPPEGLNLILFHGTHFHFVHLLVIIHILVAWFAVLPLFLSIRVKHERFGVMEAFDRIVLVNPLRFVSGIYHARVMSRPITHHRRAQAVESAGESGTEVVVTDLIARLSDPSADVREAAARSLGRIGTSDAIDALVKALQEPGTDLAAYILRALRQCGDERATTTALARLNDENLEVVREAARTLGALEDKSASPALLDLLLKTRHDAIAMAAAESLGRLGELSAVYQIMPRMRTSASPMVRRAFAAASGDLLGDPDGFYRILTQEEQSHSAGITALIHRIRSEIRHMRTPDGDRQRTTVEDHITSLEHQYENRDFRSCASTAFRLAVLFAELRYDIRYTGDIRVFLAKIEKFDPKFAVGVWYLAVLDGVFQRIPNSSAALAEVRELVEVQLAIYILASWAHNINRRDVFEPTAALAADAPTP